MKDTRLKEITPRSFIDDVQNVGITSALKLNEFRKLWIGQIFSQLADKFYIVLMVYLIAQHWVINTSIGGDALAEVAAAIRMDFETSAQKITLLATGIYIANTIPAILLGTFAGVCADRWPKRRIMVASNGIRAILLIFAPICLIKGPILLGIGWGYWGLILMTLIESVLTQFFAPAEQSAIPILVPKKYLLAANSLYQATSMGATIVGFAIGDPLLRLLREFFLNIGINGGEFFLLPFCYGIAAISINSIKLKEEVKRIEYKSVWIEIGEGLKVLKDRPSVRKALINLVILYSLLAALYVLAISLASSIKELGPTKFGTLLSITGLGMAIGAFILAQIGNRFSRVKLTASGLGAITWSLILLGHSSGNLTLTLILCAVLGVGAAFVAIPAQTTLQEDTPEEQRGKVFGLQNNLVNIALSLPLVIAGTLISKFGIVPVLWLLAFFALITALSEQPWKRC